MYIGWAEGVLIDGRPFSMQLARVTDLEATFYMSSEGIAGRDKQEWADFLAEQELVRFKSTEPEVFHAEEVDDDRRQPMWAIEIVVQDPFGVAAELLIPWRAGELGTR